MQLAPVTPGDDADIAALLDECFGAARHLRTAYRLRTASAQLPQLGRLMLAHDGRLLGSIQYWRLALVTEDERQPLVMLGPLAVISAARRQGVGQRLMDTTLALADAGGGPTNRAPILLIGDPGYYGRFGFSPAATGGWELPGPVERHRLLLRNPGEIALPVTAEVQGSKLAPAMLHSVVVGIDGSYTPLVTV